MEGIKGQVMEAFGPAIDSSFEKGTTVYWTKNLNINSKEYLYLWTLDGDSQLSGCPAHLVKVNLECKQQEKEMLIMLYPELSGFVV